MKKTLGEFIQEQMKRRNMSASEFARLVGMSVTAMSQLMWHGIREEMGGRPIYSPSIETLKKIADATETDVGDLVKMALGLEVNDPQRIETVQSISSELRDLPSDMQEMVAKEIAKMLYSNIIKSLKSDGDS